MTKRKKTEPTRVRVTRKDIREGKAGDCFRCAVGRALHRATGDDHANVYVRDWTMYIEVWSRHIMSPDGVRQFVNEYDDLPRTADGKVFLPNSMPDSLKPFAFDLPPPGDPDWQERCYGCEGLFQPAELDEGCCVECLKEGS